VKELHKHWGKVLIRGLSSITFGLICLLWPGIGIQLIVFIFGIYCFVDGLIALLLGNRVGSGILMIEGIIGILLGLWIWVYTDSAVTVFILAIGFWALVTGVLEIIAAIELRRYIKDELWLLFVGASSILLGLIVFADQTIAEYAFTLIVGLYTLIFGIFLTTLALKIKDYSPKSPSKHRKKKR